MVCNIDCFERMKSMEEKTVDLIVTDPPYGIGFKGVTSNTEWDNLSGVEYYNFITRFLGEAQRVLKDNGTIWMCCGRTQIPIVFMAVRDCGLKCNLENWLTYVRTKGRASKNKPKSQCEEVLHITKNDKYEWHTIEYLREVVAPYMKNGKPRGWVIDQNTGMRVRWSGMGNALFFTSPFFKNKFEKQIHSTQKPILLWCELIMASSKKGDLVFDPFCGSGSSGVAAEICGRKYMGCELDKEMYEKANNWVNNIDYELVKEYVKTRIR